MADAIVSVVIDTLKEFTAEEDHYLFNAKGENLVLLQEFRKQSTELLEVLKNIKSLLKDADARRDEDMVRTWVRQIRSLAYRAEDLVEKHAVHYFVLKKKEPIVLRLFRKFGIVRSELTKVKQVVGGEILDVKDEIAHLMETLKIFGIHQEKDVNLLDERQRFLRITLSKVEDEGFIRKEDDDLDSLVDVVRNTKKYKIVSLSGMGGSGKTTMARKIYSQIKEIKGFETFAWVCITQDCVIKKIKVELLKQLSDKNIVWNITDDKLDAAIKKATQNKKCLVVIDDIWRRSDWEELKTCFSDTKNKNWKSKILITTRNEEIADIGYHYRQRLFNDIESFELLEQKVPAVRDDESFENLGREMVKKCGGLPLAIAALGVTLSTKLSIEEWEMVNRDFNSTLPLSLGDGDSISSRLGLSYDDLPPHLRPCFLYMSNFGHDEQLIDPKKLYHLWIAEGIVPRYPSSGEKTSMDVAEEYLKELHNRGMVQADVDPVLGRLLTCHLHVTMRELSLRKAKQEDFLEVQAMDSSDGTSIVSNVRRLAIQSEGNGAFVSPVDNLRIQIIRALSLSSPPQAVSATDDVTNRPDVPGRGVTDYHGKIHKMVASAEKLKLLRVLNFEGYRFFGKKLPGKIAELIHLRYLSLYGSDVTEFPASVGNLPLLLTLDLRTIISIKIPHDVFSKKKRLKHLYLNKFQFETPGKFKLLLNGLTELESLILGETISDVDLKHLSNLVKVRCFEAEAISNQTDYKEIMEQSKSWKKIKVLKVGISTVEAPGIAFESSNVTDLKFSHIPTSLVLPTNALCVNIVSLDIVSCKLIDHAFVGLLGKLRKLRKFSCSASDPSITEMNFSAKGGFVELRSLELYDMVGLKKLRVAEGGLPNLITLGVGGCEKLEIQPEDGLRFVPSLRELGIQKDSMVGFKEKVQKYDFHYEYVSIKEV